MSSWSEGDVTVGGVRLHYHRTGGNRPPLVLLHGFSDSGRCWTRVARALQGEWDVVMPDARGHGASDRIGPRFDPALRMSDAAGVIEGLGLRGAVVGGHSMGAMTAAEVAAERPDLVGRLVLEDPPWRDQLPAAPEPGRWDYVRRAQEMAPGDVPAYGRRLHPAWAEDEIGPWAAAKLAFDLSQLDAPAISSPRAWQAVVAAIRCPALLITGDPELGAIVTADGAAEVERLGGVRIAHIAGAGHNVRRERYEPYMDALGGFLRD